MENEYILIIDIRSETRKIFEKALLEDKFEMIKSSDEEILLAKKTLNQETDKQLEEQVLRLVLSIARKYKNKGIISLDLSKEINTIIEEKDKDIENKFKIGNCERLKIRQAITKAIISKHETEDKNIM